jgi:hypothetical protein
MIYYIILFYRQGTVTVVVVTQQRRTFTGTALEVTKEYVSFMHDACVTSRCTYAMFCKPSDRRIS